MQGVLIGRPINGISINGNEYVCDAKAEYDRGTAHWSCVDDVINHNQVLICSNCNATLKTSKGLIYPFCPYCGARMIEEENE